MFDLAWLESQAFTWDQPGAILSYPITPPTMGIYPLRKIYETDDGTGMVIFGRFHISNQLSAAALVLLAFMGAAILIGATLYLRGLASLPCGGCLSRWVFFNSSSGPCR